MQPLHVVLFQPQIPQNTGNIGRMCAVTGSKLHLIDPLGFEITDRHLRRSGMDYWYELALYRHANWESFVNSSDRPRRLWLFTTKATKLYWDVQFEPEDGLLFGNESSGVPDYVHQSPLLERITLPQMNPKLRSLNLSTAAGIATYEALRQLNLK